MSIRLKSVPWSWFLALSIWVLALARVSAASPERVTTPASIWSQT